MRQLAAATLLLALAGCESTQDKSARLEARASKAGDPGRGLEVTKRSREVRVVRTRAVQDENGTAVVVELRNRSRRALAALPIAVAVRDRAGKSLYANDVAGLDESLVAVPSIAPGGRLLWVHDQVTASGPPARVRAAVGAGARRVAGPLPRIALRGVHLEGRPRQRRRRHREGHEPLSRRAAPARRLRGRAARAPRGRRRALDRSPPEAGQVGPLYRVLHRRPARREPADRRPADRSEPMTYTDEPDTTLHRAVLGAEGEPCAVCRAPLAADQRYCLNCGTRRAEARLPFLELLDPGRDVVVERPPAPPPPSPPPRRAAWALAAGTAGAALLALGLAAGMLVSGDDPPAPVAAKPPVVNITNAVPAAPAATAAPVSFTSDWPAGQEAWTVQLQSLPKGATTPDAVRAAKDAATTAGAPDVGALDSDAFDGLDAGAYMVYSGVFDTRKEARRALADLKQDFPAAAVVQVGGGAEVQSSADLKRKKNLSPEEAQKEIRKAPDKVQSEGAPPPKDNKESGGGSEATEIGE